MILVFLQIVGLWESTPSRKGKGLKDGIASPVLLFLYKTVGTMT